MQIPRIDTRNALGLMDKVVGLGKEIAGSLTGRDRLAKAGQTQQEKGTERMKAVRAQMDAKKHETKAATADRAERAAQKRKESVNS
jgi:uncharacterized protein YjbJ (UPF0337 family)